MVKPLNSKKTLKRKYKQKGGINSDEINNSLNKTVSNSKNLLNESVDKATDVMNDVSKNIVKNSYSAIDDPHGKESGKNGPGPDGMCY